MSGPQDKPFDISKQLVWEAYRRVKANQGLLAAGVDGMSYLFSWAECWW